jgi:hypothetical protein
MDVRVRWEIDIELPDPEDYPGTIKDMLTDACQQAQLIMSEQLISSSPDVHRPYFDVMSDKKQYTVDFDRGDGDKPTIKRRLRTKVQSFTTDGGRHAHCCIYDEDTGELLWKGGSWPADGSAQQEAYTKATGLEKMYEDRI